MKLRPKNRNMQGFTIFKRLSLSYLAILVVIISMEIYTIWRFEQLNRITKSLSSIDSEVIRIANNTKDNFLSLAAFERKYIVSKDNDFYNQFQETKKSINKQMDQIANLIQDQQKYDITNSIQAAFQKYISLCQREFEILKKDKNFSWEKYQEPKKRQLDQVLAKLEQLVELTKADMNKKIKVSNEIGSQTLKLSIVATLCVIIMSIIIAFFNARTINRPILSLMKGTKRIANGEFDQPLSISSPPEIKDLADSFNYMSTRLQELDQMKADFISHVSHELRTPLTSIKEATNLLIGGSITEPSEKQSNLLFIIQEECERLIHSVNSILDLSRMEAGMMEYQMEKYSLYSLLEKSVSKLKLIAEKKGIQMELNISENLSKVFVDWEKVDQVIVNLLSNALKFTTNGGKVIVSAYNKKTNKNQKNQNQGMVEVSVSDTGCGISSKDLGGIFDKFKKVHGKGTGLGLAIAKNVIAAHGGEIWIESKLNKGSTFFFTLPAVS